MATSTEFGIYMPVWERSRQVQTDSNKSTFSLVCSCLIMFEPLFCPKVTFLVGWVWNIKNQYTHDRLLYTAVAIIIIINPFTARVVGVPQMILQPVFSIFPCSQLPSGTCRTSGLSIPWCCLPTSSSVCLVFFPLSLCLARWFWPDLMNGGHVHTTAKCNNFLSAGTVLWCLRVKVVLSAWSSEWTSWIQMKEHENVPVTLLLDLVKQL